MNHAFGFMAMREVRYNRWSAWLQAGLGLALAGMGIVSVFAPEENELAFGGLIFVLVAAIILHRARLRLKEQDVLLRLTLDKVWTKEFGWQPWEKLVVSLEYGKQGYILEMHKPDKFTPRFYENVSTLNIDADELKKWIKRTTTP